MHDKWTPPHPVVFDGVDEVLKGSYDIHVHSSPDIRPRLMDVVELVADYRRSGFAGAVLKDHFLPTAGRAFVLNKQFGDFRCFSAGVLNASIGGLNPAAVEAAVAQGASIIYMPTATSAHHIRRHGRDDETEKMLPHGQPGISIFDESGKIKREVYDILDILAAKDTVLASGHLSPEETAALMMLAKERHVERRIVTHASIDFIDMPVDMQKQLASQGTYIEHCYISCTTREPVALEKIAGQIKEVGSASVILSSDFGQPRNPAPSQGMRYFIAGFRALDFSVKMLREMVVTNPERLLLSRSSN